MRIALVSVESDPSAAPGRPGHGAQGVHVGGLAAALSRVGHEVVVEVMVEGGAVGSRVVGSRVVGNAVGVVGPDKAGRDDGVVFGGGARVRHHDLGRQCSGDAARLPGIVECLRREWRRWRPDVVHAHSWLSALAATAATRDAGIPLVVSFHSPDTGARADRPSRVCAQAVQAVAGRAGRILAANAEEALGLARKGVDGSVIRVLPNGVDTETFAPLGRSLRRGRRPRLLTVGSLGPDRGVHDVVSALLRVQDAELLVAGGPVTGDEAIDPDADPGLESVRVHADRVGVLPRVRLLGAVGRDLLPALIRSADVLVHVPHRDAFATAALEAMSCERPVVASTVGTLNDVVVDHVTGLLVPPADPDRLGRTLRTLLGEPTRRTAFGIAGRDRAMSCFSWSRLVPAVEARYDEARDRLDTATPVDDRPRGAAAPHARRGSG